MRRATDSVRALIGLAILACVLTGFDGAAEAQSTTQPNPIPGAQHIIINPGPPSGPGSLAPNPPPPPPPSGTIARTPRNPDPGKPDRPRDNRNRTAPPDDPGRRSEPEQDDRTAGGMDEQGTPDRLSPGEEADSAASLTDTRSGTARSRAKAMESSALDAPRPTFSLLETNNVSGRIQTEADLDHEPDQVLINVESIDQARAIQSQLAPEGYRVKSRRVFRQLEMVVLLLTTPSGVTAVDAVNSLSARYPDLVTDLNHRYTPSGLSSSKTYAHELLDWKHEADNCRTDAAIGMIDTAIAIDHPVFAAADIEQLSVLRGGTAPASADHGTGVAALLVGNQTSEFARGMVPDARLIAVESFRSRDREQIDTTTQLVIAALDKLLGQKVRVVNLSFGGPANRLLEIAVRRVTAREIPLIAATGQSQSGSALYPAGYDEVIAVSAVDARLALIKQTAMGAYIDVVAPGVDIWTATADGNGKYATGTSFATPYVSAFVARLTASGRHLSAKSAIAAIRRTARDLGEPGHDHRFGWGLLSFEGICLP